MVTTSPTSATQTVAQNATSQLLQSLGAGSGIDMTALATNLANAQFAAKTDRLTTRAETLEKQISTASTLKSAIANLATSLGSRVRVGDLSPQPQVANAAVAKATLSGTTQPKGAYSLEVTSLAAAQTLASPAYASATAPAGAGTLTLKFGTNSGGAFTEDTAHAAVDITIASGATLADVASAINAKNTGVTAYVSNTTAGAKLVLKGADGAANGFVLEATETVGEEGLANLAWNPAAPGGSQLLSSASNANFKIDGLPVTSASNTITDAIPGVTLNLTGTNTGLPTQLSFSDPSANITEAMSDLTSALNEVMASLNDATNAKTGDLARDGGALALKRTMSGLTNLIIMPGAPEGTPRTLADLGVSIQRDGTFSLDSKRLADTLKTNAEAAGAMFTNGLYGVYATIDGISRAASVSTNPGSLGGSITRMTSQMTQTAADKAKLVEKQEVLRAQLVARFSTADSAVGASKSTLSFLKNQIAAWNNSSNS
jgi:flagellar hook-associated protein 2